MDYKERPEFAGFVAAMTANPGDATTLGAAADWIEEHGGNPPFEYGIPPFEYNGTVANNLRETVPVLRACWAEWAPFATRLAELTDAMDAFGAENVIPSYAHIPRSGQKKQASAARELFKTLGLKGISVTMARGSMCFWVEVTIPGRIDWHYWIHLEGSGGSKKDTANVGMNVARTMIRRILDAAFPNHHDRSDSLTDHFDDPWMIHTKGFCDYEPKPKKEKKSPAPKVVPIDGLDAKIDAFVEAWHENGRLFWNYEWLDYDHNERKSIKDRRKYVALDCGTSGAFLVEKATGLVWSIKAYGVPNRIVGTLEELTEQYREATAATLARTSGAALAK